MVYLAAVWLKRSFCLARDSVRANAVPVAALWLLVAAYGRVQAMKKGVRVTVEFEARAHPDDE